MSTSLKAGLAALPETAEAVLVLLADMPRVTPDMIDRLIAAYEPDKGALIVVPTFEGRRGNPVLWSRRFFPDLSRIAGDIGARNVIGDYPEAVVEIELGAAVALDLDTREAIAEAGGTLVGGELPDSFGRHRGEEIDQGPIGIAKQQRPVSPRLRRRRLDDLVQDRPQPVIVPIHVIDVELDDRALIVCRPGRSCPEQVHRPLAADCQRTGRCRDLGEVLGVPGRRQAGHLLVEFHQTLDVVGDDARRDIVHLDLPVWTRLQRTAPRAQSGRGVVASTVRCGNREIAMRRADRLFQIIQVLRRSSQPVTAGRLAEELEVSKRSIYRDIAELIGQRVPIRGEAGLGYVLDHSFDMPALML
eukprot:gene29593-33300_t